MKHRIAVPWLGSNSWIKGLEVLVTIISTWLVLFNSYPNLSGFGETHEAHRKRTPSGHPAPMGLDPKGPGFVHQSLILTSAHSLLYPNLIHPISCTV